MSELLSNRPAEFVKECVDKLLLERSRAKAASEMLMLMIDAAVSAGHSELARKLQQTAGSTVGVHLEAGELQQFELLDAALNQRTLEVAEMLQKERDESTDLAVSQQSLIVAARGYMMAGEDHRALDMLLDLGTARGKVSCAAVVRLAEAACKSSADQAPKVLEALAKGGDLLSTRVFTQFAEHALRTENYGLANRIKVIAQEQGAVLSLTAGESLLKLWVRVEASQSAIELFNELVAAGLEFSEGFCRFLISRCADVPEVELAEQLADYLRSRNAMTLAGYKTLMKVYSVHGYAGKACDLFEEVREKGWEVDSAMLAAVIKLAMIAGRSSLIQELRVLVAGMSPSRYVLLIRALGQIGDVQGAFEIFHKLSECETTNSLLAFNLMIDVFVANKELGRACKLVEEMTRADVQPNLVSFNTLMKGYCLADDFESAMRCLDRILDAGMEPDMVSYRCLLNWAIKAANFDCVMLILKRMEKQGATPDWMTFAMVMQFARRCQPQQAARLLTMAETLGAAILDDLAMFNATVDVCIVHRETRRLALLVDAFDQSHLVPDTRTYGLLIKANAVLRKTQRSFELWQELVKSETLQPNGVALGCAIDALVEGNRVEEALSLFQDWKKVLSCDTVIYSTLIKGFASVGDADRAMALYHDMKANGVVVNTIVYSTLISVCTKRVKMDQAEGLLEEMARMKVPPNSFTFSSMIRGYTLADDLESAVRVYNAARDYGFETNPVIYNTLLDGCIHLKDWKKADTVLLDMDAAGVPRSTYTVSIIVKMWSKRGNLDNAFATVAAALEDGRPIDSQVGACIIGACFHNKAPVRAMEVYANMRSWKNFGGVDEQAYSALIGGLTRYNYVKEAVQIATDASETLKVKPGYDKRPLAAGPVRQLFQALARRGLTDEVGRPLALKLQEAGTHVSADLL